MVVSAAGSPRVGRGVALGRLFSPGSMAGSLWRSTGLTAPLAKFEAPDDEALGCWLEAAHGGWVTAEVTGALVPCLDADIRSAYPAAWSLARWWDVVRAASVTEVDVCSEVVALARRAADGDLGVVVEQANYPTLGRTVCCVHPTGEPWPTERPGRGGVRLVVAPVAGDELYATLADVVAAAYLSGREPEVVSAVRLDPVGEEDSQPVRLRDEVVVPAGEDPIPALIGLRPPKGHDERLRSVIRGIANAAAWGIFARLDAERVNGRLTERPSTWTWPPVAACVPALARLWLAAIERAVADRGGAVINRDTDGIVIASLPEGGAITLPSGRTVQALAWADLEELLAGFDDLDPFGVGTSFWDVEHGSPDHPLHLLALAAKRYVEAVPAADGWEVVGGTEHALGGGLVDPPSMVGRGLDRRHRWVDPVAAHALAMAQGQAHGFEPPWDTGPRMPFPAIARWSVGSPAALARVPVALGAHAFAPLVEARVDRLLAPKAPAPLAPDPGDDLDGWTEARWIGTDGQQVAVSTGPDPGASVPLTRLADVAADWAIPVEVSPAALLTYDRRLARRVGRGGALVDARLADPDAVAYDHQALYAGGDAAGFVAEEARRAGPRPFARLTGLALKVAERAALGQPISADNVERALAALCSEPGVRRCALEGCEAPVPRPNARFCSKAHADRAYRARRSDRRQRGVSDPYAAIPTCTACGVLMLGGADTGTGLCIDCNEGDAS